ncbi:MAG TPA: hypothetical protein VE619_03415 [Nitrososphaeraceae archaeon]|nr:hypothetical protein [Nitrososphaeraceae archaeon]
MSCGSTTAAPIPSAYYSSNPCRNYYYNEYRKAPLRVAKGLFNNLLNQLADMTMVATVKEKLIDFKYNNNNRPKDCIMLQFTRLNAQYCKTKK